MSKSRILFLYATQALATRKRIYIEACRELCTTYGHEVVFCYNGPRIASTDGLRVEHFDSWVEENREEIERHNLGELERRFPASNFWRAVVVERNLTDYSFVGASFPSSKYGLAEIEWYLKALVLFYDYVLDRYSIDVAFNQVSDNIHAHVIYELARSKAIIPLSVGRGIYWLDEMVYPQTELNYSSRVLVERYHALRRGTAELDTDLLDRIENQLVCITSTTAGDVRPQIIYTKTIQTITSNALSSLRDNLRAFKITRPTILESNRRLSLWVALRSYLARLRNLVAMRLIVRERDLPSEPFVFFPLHYQPEATLLGASPGWLDQLALVRLLSASLPAGYRLVTKEHPAMAGMRPPSFYRAAKDLKNVVLLDERVSGREIAKASGCALVTIIGGTVGLEAMLFGKPVLAFGRVYFDCMDKLLRPPRDLNDLPLFMKRVLAFGEHPAPAEIEKDAKTFFAAWLSVMKPAGKATYWVQEDPSVAGRDWARVVHEMILQVGALAPAGDRQ